jgi:hypothetical protein
MADFTGFTCEITTLITVWLQVVGSRVGRIDLTHGGRLAVPSRKFEAALKCRSCRMPRYSPPVHMIRLTGFIRTRSVESFRAIAFILNDRLTY